MKFKFFPEILAVVSIFATSATGAFAQVEYSVTDLGQINTSYALSINNSGQVAMQTNAISIISPLGKSINDSGQILQGASLLFGGGTVTPVVGIDGTGINNSGQIVGTLHPGDTWNHAVLYNGFTITDFGYGSAIAINDSGQVVGFNSVLRDIANQAYCFNCGGALAQVQSWATAINNNGVVVGGFDTTTFYHAFSTSGGDLGTLPGTTNSEAHGINDSGQIVGYCFGVGVAAAFIYTNGTMTDLNSLIPTNSGWTLINAEGINNSGQIVGYGSGPSGHNAFLLTVIHQPIISSQPQNQAMVAGGNVTFNITAYGPPPLAFQWLFNSVPIVNATNTSLTISNFDLTQAGAYSVTVSNQFGITTAVNVLRLTNSPVVLVDGVDVGGGTVDRFNSAQVAMSTTFSVGASIYYTLDGSAPDYTKTFYSGSFALTHSATIRAVAYNQPFTASAEAAPITVQMFGAATDGGGSVSLSPAPGSGFDGYVTNTLVTATATASNGWTFLGWLGNATGTNPVVTAAMTPDKEVKAVFGAAVSTNVLGSGSIILDPAGLIYPYGSSVRVWAVPQNGNRFFGWQGSVTGTNNPATLVINQPTQTVTATFASLSAGKYSLTAACDGKGSVTVNPYATYYNNGQTVTLTPLPDAGQSFIGWTGDASGTANPLVVTMNQSQIITATFSTLPSLQVGTAIDGMFENGFMLTLNGEFGVQYQILNSTNLATWTPLGTVTNTFGESQFLDANGTNAPLGFYRLMQTGQ